MCTCCGYKTLEDDEGSYDICPICFWEDDPYQNAHVYEAGGANTVSLIEAQKNYMDFGACERRVIPYTREPYNHDKKDPACGELLRIIYLTSGKYVITLKRVTFL